MTRENDLIRRGDAVLAVTAADKECLGANGAREFIRAIPADPVTNAGCRQKLDGIAGPWFAASAAWHRRAIPAVRVGVTPEEAALEEQIEKLRNLCDCDCDDEDCVKCAHYPAILEQKKDELARILAALEAAPRVNETPKSEHDSADVLIAPPAAIRAGGDA